MQTQTSFNNLNTNQLHFLKQFFNNSLMSLNTLFPAKIVEINGLRATIETIINPIFVNQSSPSPMTITNVPIGQLSGNGAGIIIQYAKDDIVLCGAIQRDISSIKNTWSQANPASARKFSLSDAVILLQLSNSLPEVFIEVLKTGVNVTAPVVTINSNNINLGGSGGAAVLTTQSVINDSQGKPCSYVKNASITTKAV